MSMASWFGAAFLVGIFYGVSSVIMENVFWTLMAGPSAALLGFLFGFASRDIEARRKP